MKEARSSADRQRLIYRWDLDKTYLRTEFDTLRQLLRTAFEKASLKRTVPGASGLLREIRQTTPAGIFILSGSPEQMRRVLEAKLRLDGIHWDAFTLKPSLHNLLRGRLRFLRDQLSYKLAALLSARSVADPNCDEVLFGDDAEADAFIYSLYADLCADQVSTEQLMAVLREAQVYEEDVPLLVRAADRLPRRDCVRRIFIHLDRVSSLQAFAAYGSRVCPFHNYFQPALVLLEDDAIGAEAVLRIGAEMIIEHAFSPDALSASFADLLARGLIGVRAAERLLGRADIVDSMRFSAAAPTLRAFLQDIGPQLAAAVVDPSPNPGAIDYVDLFVRDRARARAARRRAKWHSR